MLAEPHIERSLAYSDGLVRIGDVEVGVLDGSKQLWVVWGDDKPLAWGVSELINGTCFVWAISGKGMKQWFHLHEEFEEWAKASGCDAVHFFGRQGWERALRKFGFERRLVVMRKEL